MSMHSKGRRTRVEPPAISRADVVRALGVQMRLALTREERAVAARALLAFRERSTGTCELCGAPFERYLYNPPGLLRRFCSRAHKNQAYQREHGERLREQALARRTARRGGPEEKPC